MRQGRWGLATLWLTALLGARFSQAFALALPAVMVDTAWRGVAFWTRCAALWALPVVLWTGCKDVTRFNTEPGENYCGPIVQGTFVRQGFKNEVLLRLSLDLNRLDTQPGVLSTSDQQFVDAPLLPIKQLPHDPLSTFQFGEGRVRNFLFGVNPVQGATAWAVISLLENGDVEVRLLRGASLPAGAPPTNPPQDPQLFGVFPLVRQRGTCGF